MKIVLKLNSYSTLGLPNHPIFDIRKSSIFGLRISNHRIVQNIRSPNIFYPSNISNIRMSLIFDSIRYSTIRYSTIRYSIPSNIQISNPIDYIRIFEDSIYLNTRILNIECFRIYFETFLIFAIIQSGIIKTMLRVVSTNGYIQVCLEYL